MNNKTYKLLAAAILTLHCLQVSAQETFPVNGVKEKYKACQAFTHITLHPDPETTITDATLVVKDGEILSAGKANSTPKGCIVTDMQGRHIYPSFIDPYSSYGIPKPKPAGGQPQPISQKKGAYHWNAAIAPETQASQLFAADKLTAKEYRSNGYGVVLTHNTDGIARGTGMLVALNDEPDQKTILNDKSSTHFSFNKGSSTVDYPSSLMGSIALLRQLYSDADWYTKSGNKSEKNLSLEALFAQQNLPHFFEVKDKHSILRAAALGKEIGKKFIIKGGGDEYQLAAQIKQTGAQLIIPLEYPKAYDVEDPLDAQMVSLAQLQHWDKAPANAAILDKNKVVFAFTTYDLKDKTLFLKNVREAVKNGLPKHIALEALTTRPAAMLNESKRLGKLQPGYAANFIITNADLFDDESQILENWVLGKSYTLQQNASADRRGNYTLAIAGQPVYKLEIKGKAFAPEASVYHTDTLRFASTLSLNENLITLLFTTNEKARSISYRLSGYFDGADIKGTAQLPDGTWQTWKATKVSPFQEPAAKAKQSATDTTTSLRYNVTFPLGSYGFAVKPQANATLFKNATVWTNEKEGIVKNTDVLIADGKIVAIGNNLDAAKIYPQNKTKVATVDASGKHLTSGIIDEHSHIGISGGVNEGTQAVTSEVRIADVINPEDINIYRQLAGGVTAVQQLHGSANPIGGQSSLIKLRWGSTAPEMKIADSPKFIKFALGENVKQSNWGDNSHSRFPQTRMGVEQVFYDAFIRALEYEQAQKTYDALPASKKKKTTAPRKDYELEALVEILHDKRFITCHSYVQSEINMLLHVADSLNFRINTFTHILEGYKLADKLKQHNTAASTFADWWAYKFEVNDAIPYNGALLQSQGVLTAFNSDDAEMGRRLNQEAAKAVKYGGMTEEQAWKLVTLNPAKILHLDKQMGSIAPGKDADLVLWTDNPLSVYSHPLQTYVDGALLFDQAQADKQYKKDQELKAKLIEKVIAYKKNGGKTQKPTAASKKLYHCDDLEAYENY